MKLLKVIYLILSALYIAHGSFKSLEATESYRPPNFIIIFTDDQGYGDLSCFGGTHVSTPNIDRMAEEGTRLTSFYVAAPVCTPSRAALMTGSYPRRV